jgi:heme exporter protein C
MVLANRTTETKPRAAATAAHERRPERLLVASIVLGALSLVGMLVSIWADLIYAPTDAIEGDAQRIFYFHVPSAWLGMLSFCVLAVAGVVYLWKQDERWDWIARAAAEIGVVFITVTLITGSLWGRPIWGTWWTWDARLTTTLILWFIYIAYLMLRSYMGHTPASARAGAVLGIVGVIDVPIIYESVNWWRTLHPQAVLPIGSSPNLPPQMLLALMLSLATFTLLYCFLMIQVYQFQKLQTQARRLRASVE